MDTSAPDEQLPALKPGDHGSIAQHNCWEGHGTCSLLLTQRFSRGHDQHGSDWPHITFPGQMQPRHAVDSGVVFGSNSHLHTSQLFPFLNILAPNKSSSPKDTSIKDLSERRHQLALTWT